MVQDLPEECPAPEVRLPTSVELCGRCGSHYLSGVDRDEPVGVVHPALCPACLRSDERRGEQR